jgi:hypothetical protein
VKEVTELEHSIQEVVHLLHLSVSLKSHLVLKLSKICRVYLLSQNSCRTQTYCFDQHKPHMTLEYGVKQIYVYENLYYFSLAMITVCF